MLSGTVLYATPHERLKLGPGVAGFVNANVLHMMRAVDGRPGVDLLIHEFRPRFIAEPRSLPWSRYVEPLTSTTSIELFATGPGDSATRGLRETLRSSFDVVEEGAPGWELRVRDAISEVWLGFVGLLGPRLAEGPAQMPSARDERERAMLDFVGAHYPERIGVRDVAPAAFASERECHRTFREALGVTPAQTCATTASSRRAGCSRTRRAPWRRSRSSRASGARATLGRRSAPRWAARRASIGIGGRIQIQEGSKRASLAAFLAGKCWCRQSARGVAMAEIKHNETLSELKDLRAWRAFLVKARGRVMPLDALRFTLSMTLDDALAA